MAGVMVTLDDENAEQLRALIREKGERQAARIIGVASTQTLFRAAAGITISQLTHTLICDRLGVVVPPPAMPRPVVEVAAVVPAAVAPPKTRQTPAKAPREPSKPDGVARWRTVTRAGDELAVFSRRCDAERGFKVDVRAHALVAVTGEVVLERPRKRLA